MEWGTRMSGCAHRVINASHRERLAMARMGSTKVVGSGLAYVQFRVHI